MGLFAHCRPGDKLQTRLSNERGTVNLSIRVSDITIRQEHFRILALNDINNELDEKEIDSWIRLTHVLTHEIMNSVTPITSLSDTLLTLIQGSEELKAKVNLSLPIKKLLTKSAMACTPSALRAKDFSLL